MRDCDREVPGVHIGTSRESSRKAVVRDYCLWPRQFACSAVSARTISTDIGELVALRWTLQILSSPARGPCRLDHIRDPGVYLVAQLVRSVLYRTKSANAHHHFERG